MTVGLCECGHPLVDHAESGWGPRSVCVAALDDESAGFGGVCACVRHGDRLLDARDGTLT